MTHPQQSTEELIRQLQEENEMLRSGRFPHKRAVSVPEGLRPVFDVAEGTVREYFRDLRMDPGCGTIEINDQRYVLVRASAFSKGFLETIQGLYADKGETEAFSIGRNFLFDYAHVIGMHDARDFHQKMNLHDPIARLSAGPVHFAWSGWAFVNIHADSHPSPDDDFLLLYDHPYSFEADSWVRTGTLSKEPVCVMNSGYSSGWCEESFGLPLTAVEITCIAKGDAKCSFLMAPPHRIQEHLEKIDSQKRYASKKSYNIPTLFERKKVEEEMERSKALAEESAKAKDDFVANMSHELRTPLGAILGFADLLQKTDLDPVQQEYLEAIHTSGKSLLSIINDILDLSKLDAGKFIIESVPFSIPELMHSIQVMFSPKAAGKDLRLSCSADLSINYQVTGDPMRLTQILVNLIGNAIKFTDNGSVDVNCIVCRETGENLELHFTVRDTGIGIDPQKMSSIFDRFTQADSHITRQYGGTGLGLAITKQLIELQGGNIRVTSEPGRGTEFNFMIPYKKAQEQQHIPHMAANGETRSYGSFRKVLIVEDNLINQKLTATILHHNGFEVSIARNGRKAIDMLKDYSPDLILMDIQMPVLDGYRTTQLIRDELHIGTPIIAMTAHALSGEREKCLKAGMNDYLAKPFREPDLLDKIAYWSLQNSSEEEKHSNCVVNLDFLMEQSRNNKTFVKEMIRIFLKQYPKDREKLRLALSRQDHKLLFKSVHSLRNNLGLFGLSPQAANDLLQIEKMALMQESMDHIETLMENVLIVCDKASKELEQFRS